MPIFRGIILAFFTVFLESSFSSNIVHLIPKYLLISYIGLFYFQIVDVTADKCDQAFAYIPDISFNSLVVYSFVRNDGWRVKHNYFYAEPLKGMLTYAGLNWVWNDGIFSLALGPADKNG